MRTPPKKSADEIPADERAIERAAQEGVRRALLRHKRLGESIVVWRGGKVVEIPAEEIQVEETPAAPDRDGSPPTEAA